MRTIVSAGDVGINVHTVEIGTVEDGVLGRREIRIRSREDDVAPAVVPELHKMVLRPAVILRDDPPWW
jgi:hypothetical protein